MKNLKYFFFLVFFSNTLFSQEEIINEENISKLNTIIKLKEKKYKKGLTPIFNAIPQATGSFFKIVIKKNDDFLSMLHKCKNIDELANKFPDLQIDKDLLLIKSNYTNYDKKKLLVINSFEIENNNSHSITMNFSDSLNNNSSNLFYVCYTNEKKNESVIQGFILNENFKIKKIPVKYADFIKYTDAIVKPETIIFFDNKKENLIHQKTILDSLVKYFEIKTNKPSYVKENYLLSMKDLQKWQSKQNFFSDSLFKIDNNFKILIEDALLYAESNKITNPYLEDFTAKFISKERALNLMRQNRLVGSCSYDNAPLFQQKRIATLAAQTYNWEIFIKSFLNVMNDNVARIANSSMASQRRGTYINELTKLNININKILIGSNFKINDTIEKHYFSDGNKIAKAYADLDSKYQNDFENAIVEIIMDKSIDDFNKLNFYNTFKSYSYYLKDSIRAKEVKIKIKNLVPFLSHVIKSRIENPNKQLYDLLHAERSELEKFQIKSSRIMDIRSTNYDGNCWIAKLIDKNSDGRIIYDLLMPINEKITPLKNFSSIKEEIKNKIDNHVFLQKILNSNTQNELHVSFVKNTFKTNKQEEVFKKLPLELSTKLDFENAISLYVSYPNGYDINYILLKNNNLLLLEIPKDFSLPGYNFEDLIIDKNNINRTVSNKCYKLFNLEGIMLN
ncbi:hypothetical protein [Flavobacterium sp. J27]|uniref:hypothetical protein n=1 Tax=Flavobacterium sp. J27 TaxID=2060419 RepID=UPI00102F51B0|nr:hypothetical protein [Flavobacterium sp. J27]